MIARIYPEQLSDNWELINEAIVKSFPEVQSHLKTELTRDLVMNKAKAWAYVKDEDIKGIFITRITSNYNLGRKTFTVVLAYGVDKLGPKVFAEAFKLARKIGAEEGCEILDFYSDNPVILEYARMFEVAWESTYMQLRF